MKINQKIKIHNRFDVFKKDVVTGEEKQIAYAENIVLNSIWGAIFGNSPSAYFSCISFGSGTGTLDPARTTLFNPVGYATAGNQVITNNLKDEGWYSVRKSITLLEQAHVGVTFREIGVSNSNGSVIYTHALLKDMNGNPTSITKTDVDILTIHATVYAVIDMAMFDNGKIRMQAPMVSLGAQNLFGVAAGQDGCYLMNSVPRFVFGGSRYPAATGYYSGLAGGGNYGERAELLASFSKSSVTKTLTFSARLPATSAVNNSPYGVNCIGILNSSFSSQTVLFAWASFPNSQYLKSEIIGESIGVGDGETKEFVTRYPMVMPGAKVYVDSIEQTSGVTVHSGKPLSSDITWLMLQLYLHTTQTDYGRNASNLLGNTFGPMPNGESIWENPEYATIGIEEILFDLNNRLYCSDDLDTWTFVATSASSSVRTQIPVAYQNKRYWKMIGRESDLVCSAGPRSMLNADYASFKNIIFDTAPAEGAVITMDYDFPGIAKDANHVFDFTLTIQFGEYVPEEY